ncbi:MAG: hypothetical protein KYX62_06780 [Pseudomonadota bacterium]|nr:hypothetical protein [Pseudomonadota bacterium]
MSERTTELTRLLSNLGERLQTAQPQSAGLISDEILQHIDRVIDLLTEQSDAGYQSGQELLVDIFTHRPQLAPAIDRQLLWYFGGECLHFLTDDEIDIFQQTDELEAEATAAGTEFNRDQVVLTLKTGQTPDA